MGKSKKTAKIFFLLIFFFAKKTCEKRFSVYFFSQIMIMSIYHIYEFSMKSCEKIQNSYPCSNRPAICDHCEEIYWTYNMEIHHLKAHNEMNFNSLITDNERALIKKLLNI